MSEFRSYISQHQAWIIAISWMLLLSLFTYTEMACGLLKADTVFLDVYKCSQTSVVALVVNIGLLFMLVFDFMGAGKRFSYGMMVCFMIAVLLSVSVFGVSRLHASGKINGYIGILQHSWMLYGLHFLFLCILTWLKYKSIEEECKMETQHIKKKF